MRLIGYYSPLLPSRLVYMLQQVEYNPVKLLLWLKSMPNIFTLQKRGQLIITKASRALFLLVFASQIIIVGVVIALIVLDLLFLAGLVFLLMPVLLIGEVFLVSAIGNVILSRKRQPMMKQANSFFSEHKGVRIAVVGSYGKTSMKELLYHVLSSKLKVAMTPGNKNVAISHARWSKTLTGDEDVLIIEYGEGEPGDIDKLASLSHPTHSVVTGLAPNHLDEYKTIDSLKSDFWDITKFVSPQNIYVNDDKTGLVEGFDKDSHVYSESGLGIWKVSDVSVDISGTSFVLSNSKKKIKIASGLLGRHNIGPLVAVAIIALDLGLSVAEIEKAMTTTAPFEHRMKPYTVSGAWVIDDAYNGNLEGFKAGLRLLSELEAKRKIYVTPGLVDQGIETERVHQEIGKAIAHAKPDRVVLMRNSVTDIIRNSMNRAGYSGELEIVENPLEYYSNIDQFVAVGDLVMLQNDWTDNYE